MMNVVTDAVIIMVVQILITGTKAIEGRITAYRIAVVMVVVIKMTVVVKNEHRKYDNFGGSNGGR